MIVAITRHISSPTWNKTKSEHRVSPAGSDPCRRKRRCDRRWREFDLGRSWRSGRSTRPRRDSCPRRLDIRERRRPRSCFELARKTKELCKAITWHKLGKTCEHKKASKSSALTREKTAHHKAKMRVFCIYVAAILRQKNQQAKTPSD